MRAAASCASVDGSARVRDTVWMTDVLSQVRNSTDGFALVLAGLKALLEHDVRLNLVHDRHPDGLMTK
jgi:hypothetical protein